MQLSFDKITNRSFFFALIDRIHFYVIRSVFGNVWKLELALRGVRPLSSRRLTIIGRPIVGMGIGSAVEIGDDVILMSSSRFCLSATLYAPCKIQTILRSSSIHIGDRVSLNGTSIVCRSTRIAIGSRTMIGPNVSIVDSPFHPIWPIGIRDHYPGSELDQPVEIGEDVWIGSQTVILPGSKIGSGSVIGAGSIVRGEIPANCLAAGAPARVIRQLEREKALRNDNEINSAGI
jgi:acetyltransferase-like isoleucine patch superfamily enzyme